MFTIARRSITSHKRRFAGTFFAVFLGIAFLAGTLVFGDTARDSFSQIFTDGNAGTDVVVRGADSLGSEELAVRRPVPESLIDDIRAVPGVAAAEPSIEGMGQLVGADGTILGGDGPPTLAGNWIEDPELNPHRIVEGRAPQEPHEAVIDGVTAEAGDLTIGSVTTLRTPAPIEVEIVGLSAFAGREDFAGPSFTSLTLDHARSIFGGDGEIGTVRVRAADGTGEDELAGMLAPLLPDGVEVITATALTAEQNEDIGADFLGFFEMFLRIFSGIALLVATFSIYNTFSIILAQRSRESALLRAVGASRSQVLRSMAAESIVIGALASIAGIAAGVGLANLMKGFVSAEQLMVRPASLLTALVIGVVVTFVAGLFPAIKASGIAPVAALRETAAESTRVSWARVVFGGLLAVAGVAVIVVVGLGDGGNQLAAAGLGALGATVGMLVLGPVVARVAGRVIGSPVARFRGVSGELAQRNAMRNPKRTSSTATALMIGICVVTLFTVLAASVQASLDATLAGSFRGDLAIFNEGWSGVGLDPAMADDLAELDDVAVVASAESAAVTVAGEEMVVSVVDPVSVATVIDLDLRQGSFEALGDEAVAVSTAFADERNLVVGSPLPIGFVDGDVADLEVGAIYGMADLTGSVLMPTAVWEPHAGQRMHDMVLVGFADGVDTETGRNAVEAVAAAHGAGQVQNAAEYMETVAGELNQFLAIVYVLLALSIGIALMGIANTITLSLHERTSELGLLRAVGQTRSQLRRMVRWESVIISTFGTAGGIGLGMFLAWGLLGSADGIGTFAAPVGRLALVLVVGAGVGIVAALRPAHRAARLDVLDAIRVD